MRNHNKIFLFLFLLSGITFFVACKKDDNSPQVNYRIIASNYYSNDTLTSHYVYEYEGERMKTKWRYGFGDQMDTSRTEIEYPTSQGVIITEYRNETGEWHESIRIELDFQNDRISEQISNTFNSGSWEPLIKITWQYENGKVIEIIHHSYQSGNFRATVKIDYEYSKGEIERLLLYHNSVSGWYLTWKEEYVYDGGKVKTITGYDYFDDVFHESVKYEFAYMGSEMMSMDMFIFKDGNWGPKVETWNYLFNSTGNLISYSVLRGNETDKFDYNYEEGKGNYQQLFYYPIGQTYDILPGPTKSKLIREKSLPGPGSLPVYLE
jgi:hypothetical protein